MNGEKDRDQDDCKTTHGSLPATGGVVATVRRSGRTYDSMMKQP
jgi:hypothetical protein